MVAALLHLEERPRAPLQARRPDGRRVSRTAMMSPTSSRGASAPARRPRQVSGPQLLRVADDMVDLGHRGVACRARSGRCSR